MWGLILTDGQLLYSMHSLGHWTCSYEEREFLNEKWHEPWVVEEQSSSKRSRHPVINE